jgi:hypothetical protein
MERRHTVTIFVTRCSGPVLDLLSAGGAAWWRDHDWKGCAVQQVAWAIVALVALLGLALLVFSLGVPAVQQVAVAAMVMGFVACTVALALALTFSKRS